MSVTPIPMWAPFAALTIVTAIYPRPVWTRRIDWVVVGAYGSCLVFCLSVWFGVFELVRWAA